MHRDHVGLRLGWDASADSFGRFEFLSRHAHLGEAMAVLALEWGFTFRVYAAAPWPEGSRLVFQSGTDWQGAFEEVRRRGVWFELGLRLDLPEHLPTVTSPALGAEAARVSPRAPSAARPDRGMLVPTQHSPFIHYSRYFFSSCCSNSPRGGFGLV